MPKRKPKKSRLPDTARASTRRSAESISGKHVDVEHQANPLKRLLNLLGPGLITGASDDDPSGIGTYSVAGAALGFATLWTAIVTLPLMAVVQFLCAKIGLFTGRGLAGVLRNHYPGKLLYPAVLCLLAANTINAGADIGAIAAAINLIIPIPITLMVIPVGFFIVALQLWRSYHRIASIFKWLTLSLLAYVAATAPWRLRCLSSL
jgi:Mn2+/Fe2+ NRAMP family transporter